MQAWVHNIILIFSISQRSLVRITIWASVKRYEPTASPKISLQLAKVIWDVY